MLILLRLKISQVSILEIERWIDNDDGDERSRGVGFMGIQNPQELEKILKNLAKNTY